MCFPKCLTILLKHVHFFSWSPLTSSTGCHLPSLPRDVVQMGTTSWKESTGHNFILWWAMPPVKMLLNTPPTASHWYKLLSPPSVLTAWSVIEGLVSRWMWANFALQILSTAVAPEIKITTLHFQLVPWQPAHQNPLDIVCKWTRITCEFWRSCSLYAPKWSVTLLTVQKHSHAPCSILLDLSDNRKHIKTPLLRQWLNLTACIQWN